MPELAEVETLRRDLHGEIIGCRIEGVEVSGGRSVRRHADPAEFAVLLRGARVTGTGRRGKYLLIILDRGRAVVAHMGMSGQLLLLGAKEPAARHTHVVFRLPPGRELRFVDPRTFGQLFVSKLDPGGHPPELAGLGFDPLADADAEERMLGLLESRPTRMKPLLMDQSRVAGIGNMYADEILFAARVRPDRPARSLSGPERRLVWTSTVEVLGEAIEHRGSSLADEQYRDLYGRVGSYQKLHRVYAREGQPCVRCGALVVRDRAGGRSMFFCPACQK